MTTLVRARIPLETLSMNNQLPARRRSKRLASYEEEDGDFMFTRSKRTKTVTESKPKPAPAPAPAPSRRIRKSIEYDHEAVSPKPRRKTNATTPKPEKEVALAKKSSRKATQSSRERSVNGEAMKPSKVERMDYDSADIAGGSEADASSTTTEGSKSTVISLPFTDTPKMNRNKELRKKGSTARRSSLGLRGRRASSLIDNGHSAIPHREVATTDFYKHIEAEGLSEPRRMKQLLTWTGERALGPKTSHGDVDAGAISAARYLQEALLKDFANKSEFSDWFNREESAPKRIVKTPNPRNIEFEAKIAELEPRIKRLREERDQWKALAKPPPEPSPILSESGSLSPSQIDSAILDPEQAEILATLTKSSSSKLREESASRLKTIQDGLEFKTDQFLDGIHKLEQYQETAGRVADKILALCANRLDEREKREKEVVGTRDIPMQEVLRSLSRILPPGQ
ncbi:Mis12-Mtw1 protein family-domain-containing protein [Xylogone sp. PMI_703]|nr:Mis12-Mtw1 protein family-domain-containing protein [Xylogone sp. PMI_703]